MKARAVFCEFRQILANAHSGGDVPISCVNRQVTPTLDNGELP
jgi:hypothetical protein